MGHVPGTSSLYRIADPAVLELCDQLCAAMDRSWRRWARSSPAA